jgi:hypothetical protein
MEALETLDTMEVLSTTEEVILEGTMEDITVDYQYFQMIASRSI